MSQEVEILEIKYYGVGGCSWTESVSDGVSGEAGAGAGGGEQGDMGAGGGVLLIAGL